jgi:hypothetical protein
MAPSDPMPDVREALHLLADVLADVLSKRARETKVDAAPSGSNPSPRSTGRRRRKGPPPPPVETGLSVTEDNRARARRGLMRAGYLPARSNGS